MKNFGGGGAKHKHQKHQFFKKKPAPDGGNRHGHLPESPNGVAKKKQGKKPMTLKNQIRSLERLCRHVRRASHA